MTIAATAAEAYARYQQFLAEERLIQGNYHSEFRIGQAVDARAAAAWGWHFDDMESVTADAEAAVRRFGACLDADETAQAEVRRALAGRNLACWCRDGQSCHADVLLRVANGEVQP